jgi:hypothetical protein
MSKKIKLLYAASNRIGSYLQFKRFLDTIDKNHYDIKLAAYTKSSCDLDVNYNLDCLLNFSKSNDDNISFNGNYDFYYNEIKRFNPDIIISDLEIYTSIIAIELNILLWQFSPMLIDYALSSELKYNIGWKKNHSHLFRSNFRRNNYETAVIYNADRRFVLSYLCDAGLNISIENKFEWIRPDFMLEENFDHKIVFNKGTTTDLADAFYNQKYSIISPIFDDKEIVMQSYISEFFGFGKISNDFNQLDNKKFNIVINDRVKFLNEYLKEL